MFGEKGVYEEEEEETRCLDEEERLRGTRSEILGFKVERWIMEKERPDRGK